ncbi:hypothetical protein FHG87_006136 [Trinorchestia longiramus]|nr:hypothetical protein FHG87_006136 [Trinorchestia longiramus]
MELQIFFGPREIKTQQPWAKTLEVTKIKNFTHSLKRNFNIDTSFPDRDSQKIFNLFINSTPESEPASTATPNTNTETILTHQDMETESEQSSTETNDTQDQNSDDTELEQPWETRTKKKTTKKGRNPAHLPKNN